MTKVLVVNSSASQADSVSRQLVGELVDHWRVAEPCLIVTQRDVGTEPPPHLTPDTILALRRSVPETDAERATQTLSDRLIAELTDADVLVIGAPMYNLGVTSTLKTWFDHVLRAGVTFGYTANGPVGLVTGKRAVVIETRGGFYSDGPAKAYDAQEPHLRAMLGLMGIGDVTFIRAERLAIDPAARATAIAEAIVALRDLAESGLKQVA